MFYGNYFKKRKTKRARLTFNDFSGGINAYISRDLLSRKYSVLAYNYESGSGALKNAKGISGLTLPSVAVAEAESPILKLYFYRCYDPVARAHSDKLLAYAQNGYMYYTEINSESGTLTRIEGISFSTAPSGINYRLNGEDVIILCSEQDSMTVWDGRNAPYTVQSAPPVSSMCVHYERLFATVGGEKSSVWFSDDLDPTNWDISLEEAGYIEIVGEKGSLLKVIRFLDYVYIFRSYGISRLTAYSEQTDFSVVTLFLSSGKIYPDTVTVCGDRILFAAQDGIYAFNGISTVRIMDDVFPLFSGCDNSNAVAAFYNGKYYLACKLGYGEICAMTNNTLLEYDVHEKRINLIKGVDISSIAVISTESYNNIAFSLRGTRERRIATLCANGSFFGAPLLKCWKTPSVDFGCADREKVLRELHVITETDIKVLVSSDKLCKIVYVKGGQGIKKVAVGVRGKTFNLCFYCYEENAHISKPEVLADIL